MENLESINFNNTADTGNIAMDPIESLEQLKVSMDRIKDCFTEFYKSMDLTVYFEYI